MHIQVSLDGGITWLEAPDGVRVIVPDLTILDEEEDEHGCELIVNLTLEGIVVDAVSDFFDGNDPIVVGTRCETYDEIGNDLGWEIK